MRKSYLQNTNQSLKFDFQAKLTGTIKNFNLYLKIGQIDSS